VLESNDLSKETRQPHRELGYFFRSRRLALDTKALGLKPHAHRSKSYLSREQVADLAGISADWYGRLEGGQEANPSRVTLQALVQALRLTAIESRFVFELAGFAEPRGDELGAEAYQLAAEGGVRDAAVLDCLITDPTRVGIYVLDAYLTPLKWNAVADALWQFSSAQSPIERNFIYRLTDPYVVSLAGSEYESLVRHFVGMFRRAHACLPTPFSQQILEIGMGARIFRRFWDEHVIAEQMWPASGPFPRRHPAVGLLWVSTLSLCLSPARDQVVALVVPADAASSKKFDRLRAIGRKLQDRSKG